MIIATQEELAEIARLLKAQDPFLHTRSALRAAAFTVLCGAWRKWWEADQSYPAEEFIAILRASPYLEEK